MRRRCALASVCTLLLLAAAPASGTAATVHPSVRLRVHVLGSSPEPAAPLAALAGPPSSLGDAALSVERAALRHLDAANALRSASTGTAAALGLAPGPDLDGDGLPDLIGIGGGRDASGNPTVTIAGIRGLDGTQLWTHTEQADIALPLVVHLGANGDLGILEIAITVASQGPQGNQSATITLHLLALTVAGATIWEQTSQGTVVESATGVVASGLPLIAGLLSAGSGKADDVLAGSEDFTEDPSGNPSAAHLVTTVVSGADGSTVSQSTFDDATREPIPTPTGDLDGDGLEDYAIVSAGSQAPSSVSARSSNDGSEIWRNDNVAATYPAFALGGGDVTGDGTADVLVFSFGLSGPLGPSGSPNLFLLDGKNGSVLWSKTADLPVALGDVNGDAHADVGAISFIEKPSVAGVRYQAFDAAGQAIYATRYAVKVPHRGTSSSAGVGIGEAGDVDGDGVMDFAHEISASSGGITHHEAGVVNGRTGQEFWSGRAAQPVLAAVDGNGDDFVRTTRVAPLKMRVAAVHGTTGLEIWHTLVRVKGTSFVLAAGEDLNGDGLADVVLTIFTHSSTGARILRNAVYDGATGHRLWARSG